MTEFRGPPVRQDTKLACRDPRRLSGERRNVHSPSATFQILVQPAVFCLLIIRGDFERFARFKALQCESRKFFLGSLVSGNEARQVVLYR